MRTLNILSNLNTPTSLVGEENTGCVKRTVNGRLPGHSGALSTRSTEEGASLPEEVQAALGPVDLPSPGYGKPHSSLFYLHLF